MRQILKTDRRYDWEAFATLSGEVLYLYNTLVRERERCDRGCILRSTLEVGDKQFIVGLRPIIARIYFFINVPGSR